MRQEARRQVAAARCWLVTVRLTGRKGWPELAGRSDFYPTYEEALEATELALEQAEERLAAELLVRTAG